MPPKILESMLRSSSLIGLPVGEATEIVESDTAGIRFEPEDAIFLPKALGFMLLDEGDRNELRSNCLIAVKQYDREQKILTMLDHLKQVISCLMPAQTSYGIGQISAL